MPRPFILFALGVILRAGAAAAQEAPVKAVPQTERKAKPERVDPAAATPAPEPAGERASARGERPERSARGARGRRDADRGARGGGREAGGLGHGRGH